MIWINGVFLLIYIVFFVVYIKLALECLKEAKSRLETYLELGDKDFKKLRNNFIGTALLAAVALILVVVFSLNVVGVI